MHVISGMIERIRPMVTKGKETYKVSKYNWLVVKNDKLYVFNGITTAIVKVDKKHCEIMKKCLCKAEEIIDLELFPAEIVQTMKLCGFIVEAAFNEVEYLGVLSNVSRYNSDIRSITAVITTNCNFGCSYCFQNKEGIQVRNVMSSRVIDEIARHVEETKAKRMNLCLFGGEPLLYPETCVELCSKVKNAWGEKPGRLSMPLVTNGYFLTKNIAIGLSEVGVSVAQITLDGNSDVHNLRRPLLDGGSTFDVIVENAKIASEYMNIVVRVNIDKGYDYRLNKLDEEFNGYKVIIRPAVTRYEHCNQPERTSENISILDTMRESIGELKMEDVQLKIAGCSAVSLGMFTVMPDGELVRCWNEIDRKSSGERRSTLFDENIYAIKNIYKWLSWGPYSIESPCYSCKMLPNCGGLCPDDMMRKGKPYCHVRAETFEQAIKNQIKD
jgi:uncharacterized protein